MVGRHLFPSSGDPCSSFLGESNLPPPQKKALLRLLYSSVARQCAPFVFCFFACRLVADQCRDWKRNLCWNSRFRRFFRFAGYHVVTGAQNCDNALLRYHSQIADIARGLWREISAVMIGWCIVCSQPPAVAAFRAWWRATRKHGMIFTPNGRALRHHLWKNHSVDIYLFAMTRLWQTTSRETCLVCQQFYKIWHRFCGWCVLLRCIMTPMNRCHRNFCVDCCKECCLVDHEHIEQMMLRSLALASLVSFTFGRWNVVQSRSAEIWI